MRNRNDITTTDLTDFGNRELSILKDLLDAWQEKGLPKHFLDDEVSVMFNRNSRKVFFTNSLFQAAMLDGGELKMFHTLPSGEEGFAEELAESFNEDPEYFTQDDIEYMREYEII